MPQDWRERKDLALDPVDREMPCRISGMAYKLHAESDERCPASPTPRPRRRRWLATHFVSHSTLKGKEH